MCAYVCVCVPLYVYVSVLYLTGFIQSFKTFKGTDILNEYLEQSNTAIHGVAKSRT